MSRKLLERLQLVMGCEPQDLDTAGITGDYVSMKNYGRLLIVVQAGDGTAGSDLTVDLYQATSVAGAGAKVLNCLETGRIYTKQAATFTLMQAVTAWTKETQATADEEWTDATSGEQVNLWAFEVRAADLDVSNGFDCVRADIADPGAAKIGALLYILGDPKYPAAPELMASGIED